MLNASRILPDPGLWGLRGEMGFQGQFCSNRQWCLPGTFPHLLSLAASGISGKEGLQILFRVLGH